MPTAFCRYVKNAVATASYGILQHSTAFYGILRHLTASYGILRHVNGIFGSSTACQSDATAIKYVFFILVL
jgi:hypothetical protein